MTNPINQHTDNSWWFYDETWGEEIGPFPSKEDAEDALAQYVEDYL